MSVYGEKIAEDAVRFERLLPGPIERVWSFIVESDKRARWLCAGDMDLQAGGKVELKFHNASLSKEPDDAPPEKYKDLPERMSFTGKVVACDPPHLLTHTWESDDEYSEVTYELSSAGDRVRLVLTHRRLGSPEHVISASGGWHTHLDILDEVLSGQAPGPFWRRHTAIEAEYETRHAAA